MKMIIGWGFAIVLAIMSILFLCGKGGWLIAGYNTASSEEKANIDVKKLCRNTGIVTSIVDIFVIAFLLVIQTDYGKSHENDIALILAAVIICIIAVTFILGAILSRKK